MVKAWLHDDRDVTGRYADNASQMDPVESWLDTDCPPVPEQEMPPPPPENARPQESYGFIVQRRQRTAFSDEGNPVFDWVTIIDTRGIIDEERQEFDAVAGLTSVTAKATLLYEGDEQVLETAVVVRSDGVRYQVTSVKWLSSTIEVKMKRLSQDAP